VERRKEPRIRSYESVQLTVLGDAGYSAPAHALDLSTNGMRLVMHRPVQVNATVKVTGSDWMVLGDVRYCFPEREHFAIGLQIEHLLTSLAERARLNTETDPHPTADPHPATDPHPLPSRDREGAQPLPLAQKPKQLIA
jgi:PilZ domain